MPSPTRSRRRYWRSSRGPRSSSTRIPPARRSAAGALPDRGGDGRSARAQARRQEAAAVVADLAGDHAVQQIVLAQDEILARRRLDREAVHFVGIAVEVEELEVVMGGERLEGRGRGEIVDRKSV